MPKTIRQNKRANGFTLPEVIVASALLIIAMVPILKALTHTNLNSVVLERKTQSLCLAQGRLNKIKAVSVSDFDHKFGQNNISLGNSFLCNVSQTTVSSDLKSIAVSVGKDRSGNGILDTAEIDVTLQTRIARRI